MARRKTKVAACRVRIDGPPDEFGHLVLWLAEQYTRTAPDDKRNRWKILRRVMRFKMLFDSKYRSQIEKTFFEAAGLPAYRLVEDREGKLQLKLPEPA